MPSQEMQDTEKGRCLQLAQRENVVTVLRAGELELQALKIGQG